ncbi:MAG: bifunctional diaminohydroxyphosphoribosylaminopyrimidine deaminase/5-amino-6-(5-phosphoribosylamino)uracil reductase RibD [Chloroflexi bacterium]|nr:MAG: bifunctional diaminohydroxyphosphoribosylaminopyrimidine deaminase/5-amino-6-(5-phosphoribosylamino)uracil reductase RibD [Chloroflexota bacterium]
MTIARAVELAERGRGTTYPNPLVGAAVVRDGEVVGEGWHVRPGEPHAEVNALDAAGERARDATLYVSLEPCTHRGATPPCVDAILEAGVARVVVGVRDPNPHVSGGGVERLRDAGVDVEVVQGQPAWRARDVNAGYLSVHERGRPWVIYKAAVTLDARMSVAGDRWDTGEEARRRVHELRAWVDAVAVGMGTVRADTPRLDARGVDASKQPRRLAFGRGPLPEDSKLELRTGPLGDELRKLAQEGVQTLLLEGGATLASSFFAADLVDKLLLFVAPTLAGAGPTVVASLPAPVKLRRLRSEQVGGDVLLEAYVHDP